MPKRPTMPTDPLPVESGDGRLSLIFRGGLSNGGILLLNEYAASLEGWRGLFQLFGEIYLHQFPELRHVRGPRLLKIEIAAERSGSWETVLIFVFGAAAGGIIGNRTDAVAVWGFKKLMEWYKKAVSTYVRKKSETTDVTVLTNTIRDLLQTEGYELSGPVVLEEEDEDTLLPGVLENEDEPNVTATGRIDRTQALVERMDQLLKAATAPLDQSSERMSVVQGDGSSVLEIGPAERAVISEPLTLPPPKREWVKGRIKFERINRKTGRALFHFDGEDDQVGAHYSKIIDPSLREAGNRYTQAFSDDAPIEVWLRQTHPERGRLNFQWEINGDDPDELPLFSKR